MDKSSKTLKLGAIAVIIVTAVLMITLVSGAIDAEQLKSTLGKSVLVIGVLVLAFIGITAVSTSSKDK